MINERYQVYPNRCGKTPTDGNRGALRTGFVEENQEMNALGLAGHFAAVTYEEAGEARFYIFTSTPEDSPYPNIPMWMGPYSAHSEEIVPM
jgi:hypothetical protein